jgi:hypothetical protein
VATLRQSAFEKYAKQSALKNSPGLMKLLSNSVAAMRLSETGEGNVRARPLTSSRDKRRDFRCERRGLLMRRKY